MDKRRQHFQCEDSTGGILAFGVFYNEENVQLAWRQSVGWTQEQYHSIAKMFGVEDGVTCIRLVSTYPHYRPIPVETDIYDFDDELETIILKEDNA